MGLDRLGVAALLAALLAAGCGAHAPDRLVDGSRAARVEGLHGVASRVRVVPARALRRRFGACARGLSKAVSPGLPVVERTSVDGHTVTFAPGGGPWLYACDETGVVSFDPDLDGPWCGRAAGRLVGGRLRDPRLDIGCASRSGSPVAFAWVNPVRGARWIAVDQGPYDELYEVAGALPVRVATARNVHTAKSSANFDVTQYTADGRVLRKTRLEAFVAG